MVRCATGWPRLPTLRPGSASTTCMSRAPWPPVTGHVSSAARRGPRADRRRGRRPSASAISRGSTERPQRGGAAMDTTGLGRPDTSPHVRRSSRRSKRGCPGDRGSIVHRHAQWSDARATTPVPSARLRAVLPEGPRSARVVLGTVRQSRARRPTLPASPCGRAPDVMQSIACCECAGCPGLMLARDHHGCPRRPVNPLAPTIRVMQIWGRGTTGNVPASSATGRLCVNDPSVASDVDTFLTTVYCLIDDCIARMPDQEARPAGRSGDYDIEVLTVAVLRQWQLSGSDQPATGSGTWHRRSYFYIALKPADVDLS